jgi:hypothetical protein
MTPILSPPHYYAETTETHDATRKCEMDLYDIDIRNDSDSCIREPIDITADWILTHLGLPITKSLHRVTLCFSLKY